MGFCDTPLNWRRSSTCPAGSTCVEIAFAQDGHVKMRDSKNLNGHVLDFSVRMWDEFTNAVRRGEFQPAG